ncbi:hypothetical protein SAMN00790413_02276 [Deinococcus hopiensis KR-140]|uniref:Uncharacterized protein n=1 Tax=Deinococcus hopiensis KR-140 TaxID=695939 RepID=A0A1W1VMJ5_9DEIO|nr:hypothetical protein SAMN00790413_02276 [Deinococcus hopiensis KR-140]
MYCTLNLPIPPIAAPQSCIRSTMGLVTIRTSWCISVRRSGRQHPNNSPVVIGGCRHNTRPKCRFEREWNDIHPLSSPGS